MNLLLVFNMINCTENDLSSKDVDLINRLTRIKRSKSQDASDIIHDDRKKKSRVPLFIPTNRNTFSCEENLRFQYIDYDLESLNYGKIIRLSYFFYEELLRNPIFLRVCREIGFDVNNHIPSKEVFRSFILKFILHEDFNYKKTKANHFIQSIAWLAHNYIVHWSQTQLLEFMLNDWSIVWKDIIDSINISTDRFCYWRVKKLFNFDKITEVNKQLDKLQNEKALTLNFPDDLPGQYSKISYNSYPISYLLNPSIHGLLN